MKKLHKSILAIILLLINIVFTSCTKENGKEAYLLRLEFSSGDVWEDERYILEENKELIISKSSGEKIQLYKINKRKLTGIGGILMDASNFEMVSNQDGTVTGSIEMEGEYQKQFRKYEVENGTFKFLWRNAEGFGMNDTILKGKWTMKRK